MLRPHWGAPLGAQQQVELDRPGRLAGLDQPQLQGRPDALLVLIVA